MESIYPGEAEEVTEVKLLDRGALPSARPCRLFTKFSERGTVSNVLAGETEM